MAEEQRSVWKTVFKKELKTPSSIMIEQANLLESATGGVLKGQVNNKISKVGDTERESLSMVISANNVPAKFTVIYVSTEPGRPYPAKILSDEIAQTVREKSPIGMEYDKKIYPTAYTEDEFYSYLGSVLNGKDTQAAISSLLSLSHEERIRQRNEQAHDVPRETPAADENAKLPMAPAQDAGGESSHSLGDGPESVNLSK